MTIHGPRPDYPGALHHVICRGIERRRIFRSDRARAILSYVAVRHHGFSLTAVARHLNVAHQSTARGLARADRVLVDRHCALGDFVDES
jgi:hypothetical protein